MGSDLALKYINECLEQIDEEVLREELENRLKGIRPRNSIMTTLAKDPAQQSKLQLKKRNQSLILDRQNILLNQKSIISKATHGKNTRQKKNVSTPSRI